MLRAGKTYHVTKAVHKNGPPKCSAFYGLLMAFSSGVLSSVVALLVKCVKNIHPGQLAVYRFMAIWAFTLPQAARYRGTLLGPEGCRILLVVQGVTGGVMHFLYFMAFHSLPLGEAAVILYCSHVFVTVLARIFLKEHFGVMHAVSVVMTVAGILLITRLPFVLSGRVQAYSMDTVYGLVAAVIALIISTARYIIVRKLKDVHISVVMFHYGWMTILVSAVLTYLLGDFRLHLCGVQPWMIIALALASYAGQLLLTMAQQFEQAGPVATVRNASDIAMSFVFHIFVFHDSLDEYNITGAVLVSFAVVLVGLRKWILTLPPDGKMAPYLAWLKL